MKYVKAAILNICGMVVFLAMGYNIHDHIHYGTNNIGVWGLLGLPISSFLFAKAGMILDK